MKYYLAIKRVKPLVQFSKIDESHKHFAMQNKMDKLV